MKMLHLIIVLVPLAIVFCVGLIFFFIALLAGAMDDVCRWLFVKMVPGK